MKASRRVAVLFTGLLALIAVAAVATTSAAGPQAQASAKSPSSMRIIKPRQASILRNGLQVRVTVKVRKLRRGQRLSRRARRNPIKIKLRATSNSFDASRFRQITRDKIAKFARANRRGVVRKVVTMRLTQRGRRNIRSCAARTIQIDARGKRTRAKLVRTGRCAPDPVDTSRAGACNFIGQQENSLCLLPFPDNYYTVADPSQRTGRRINFQPGAMPRNIANQPFNEADYNRSDGFSQGPVILVRVPGLDNPEALERTDAAQVNEIGRYQEPDQPVVLIDTTTGDRWPIWTEIDSNAGSPEDTLLEIHPARNLIGGRRYIVALRDLRNSSGRVIEAPAGFRYYRDDLPSKNAAINGQRPRFRPIFRQLRESGVQRSNLYLAWDFTTASDMNNAARMLHIRNDAFADLGDSDLDDGTPTGGTVPFTITEQIDYLPCSAGDPGCQAGEDDQIIRRVRGTYQVPCYLTRACEAPARFALDANGMPTQQGTYDANFDCIIPRDGVGGASARAANRPSIYGHGLLGSANEVGSSSQKTIAVAHGFVLCATDEIGFASEDVPNTIGILNNLARFPELTDRVQQGLLNELLLGRLMIRPSGFVTDPAFHVDPNDVNSPSTIDPSNLYYQGISQGGILGGALTAVSPDFTRAYLGVPAMNYSVLLPRSIDFDEYELVLNPSYPDPMQRPLLLDLIQMLWDRSEPNGYANRMTDVPLPDTPPHEVLLIPAFGDHQVTTWQVDVEARTVGASVHEPVVQPGRWPGVDVAWGIPRIQTYPFSDSALVYFDAGPVRPGGGNPPVDGTDPPPIENVPNESGDDPHGLPRREPEERAMVSDFLQPDNLSHIDDECGGPCFAGGWTGAP